MSEDELPNYAKSEAGQNKKSELDLCDISKCGNDQDEEESEDSFSAESHTVEDEDIELGDVREVTNSNDPKKRFACGKCDKTFASRSGLGYHKILHLSECKVK